MKKLKFVQQKSSRNFPALLILKNGYLSSKDLVLKLQLLIRSVISTGTVEQKTKVNGTEQRSSETERKPSATWSKAEQP